MSMARTLPNGNSRPETIQRGDDARSARTREQIKPATGVEAALSPRVAPAPTALPGTTLRQRLQILIWNRLMYRVGQVNDVLQAHKLPVEYDLVKPIPAGRRYPGLGDAPLIFSELTPSSEKHDAFEQLVIRFTLWLKEWYGLGATLTQPYTEIGAPYPKSFAKLQPRPSIPEDFTREDKLAGVAQRGPFSFQTKRVSEHEYAIDLRALESIEPRRPFIATGGIAYFGRADDRSLKTLRIEFQGATTRPGDAGWALAERRFLTGLNSNTTFLEHLVYLHIATAGVWSIAARMAFSTRHPLRVLLQPFTEETNRVNNYNIDGLILSEQSNVPLYSGYTLEQACALLRRAALDFDVRLMDPEYRATIQGQLGDETFPTVDSAVSLFRIYRRFTGEWCRAHLKEIDLETRIFCEELDFRVANGIRKLLGIQTWQELTLDHVAHLLAVGAFAASVGHHIVNDLTRDYFMSFHLMPPALAADGHPTLGVVLEKQNSIFSAGIQRYRLMSQAAMPDELSKRLWAEFQRELRRYEDGLASADPESVPYRIHPSRVSSSIHA